MELDGFKTIYDSEVAFCPGQELAPQGLDTDSMKTFCSVDDANKIFDIARQVLPQAKLIGATGEFTATYNPSTHVLAPGPDQLYAPGVSGGRYLYRTEDGYRPMKIQSAADGLDQFVSELIASYDGSKNGLSLVSTAQGKKLVWA